MSRKRRVVLIMLAGLVVVLIAPFAIRWINGSIPRDIVGRSANCALDGAYYPVDLMVVNKLDLADQRVEISGASYSLLRPLQGPAHNAVATQRLPDGWGRSLKDVSKTWQFQTDRQTESTVATMGNGDVSLELRLPPGQGVVFNKIFELGSGDFGVIVAAGDWKVGPISYVGFARARCGETNQ